MPEITKLADNIYWSGHNGIFINGNKKIYVDPWDIEGPIADVILISHNHPESCSVITLKKITGPKTWLITEAKSAKFLKEAGFKNQITVMLPNYKISHMGLNIQTVAAYNVNKPFHKKEDNFLGFLINIDNKIIYFPGPSDFISEMYEIKADILLAPILGFDCMDAQEAARLAKRLKPQLAIPINYKSYSLKSLQNAASQFNFNCDFKKIAQNNSELFIMYLKGQIRFIVKEITNIVK